MYQHKLMFVKLWKSAKCYQQYYYYLFLWQRFLFLVPEGFSPILCRCISAGKEESVPVC